MIGLIAGDIIGSVYEGRQAGTKDFPLFHPYSTWTDDSVLGLAVAEAIITKRPYGEVIREIGNKYPYAGYGGGFSRWLSNENSEPYNSWGNGSAMRVASVGYAFDTIEDVMEEAKLSASVTHNHKEGIKGAQAIALAVFLARNGSKKDQIRETISSFFDYDLNRTVNEIQKTYAFDVSCQGSVPEAIISFLDSDSYEDTIRNAIFLGGDSDTIGAMAGAIAEVYYQGVPKSISSLALKKLPEDLLGIYYRFSEKYVSDSFRKCTTPVTGWLDTNKESLDFIIKKRSQQKPKSNLINSHYFKENVGFMKSDVVDTSKMEMIEVEEIEANEIAEADEVELEDIYSENVTKERLRKRHKMLQEKMWFHDNGKIVTGEKHLIISDNESAIKFAEYLSEGKDIQGCIPDCLLFLDLFNVYGSLNFFLETADFIHVNLNGLHPLLIDKLTLKASKKAERKEELGVKSISLWMINQVYWSDLTDKTKWYCNNPKNFSLFDNRRILEQNIISKGDLIP